MPARTYWKGYLRLSLVTIGIELFTAVNSAKDTALHQIHRPSGKRIRYEKVAPGIGAVKPKDIVKGVEIDKDEYVVLDPEELDEIKLESRRTIDLVQFVDHDEIDPRYYERPYYVAPSGDEVAAEGAGGNGDRGERDGGEKVVDDTGTGRLGPRQVDGEAGDQDPARREHVEP